MPVRTPFLVLFVAIMTACSNSSSPEQQANPGVRTALPPPGANEPGDPLRRVCYNIQGLVELMPLIAGPTATTRRYEIAEIDTDLAALAEYFAEDLPGLSADLRVLADATEPIAASVAESDDNGQPGDVPSRLIEKTSTAIETLLTQSLPDCKADRPPGPTFGGEQIFEVEEPPAPVTTLSPDAGTFLACRDFRLTANDYSDGILTLFELRERLKEVDAHAQGSTDPEVQAAARTMLAMSTAGAYGKLGRAVRTMGRLCDAYGV